MKHAIFTRFRFITAGLLLALTACGPTIQTFNATTVLSEYDPATFDSQGIKNVVITHINLGPPSRRYLDKESERIDTKLTAYLRDNGFTVLPSREFSQRWDNAKAEYGDPVDPTTGRVNMKSFSIIMQQVRDQMREQTNVDAFIFTDIIERDVVFDQGINRIARWDGVTRKPVLHGGGNGVSQDFNWATPVAAASLQITWYNIELEKIFAGRGGLELTDAVDTRSGNGFIRRREILNNDSFIEEGISLALHPLIVMDNWPGTPPAAN
jgi:hypothetical protein